MDEEMTQEEAESISFTSIERVLSMKQLLNNGTELYKMRPPGLCRPYRFYRRRYYVDTDSMRLFYTPFTPTIKHCIQRIGPFIALNRVSEVRNGWHSDCLSKIRSDLIRTKRRASVETLADENCFSLLFDNGSETEVLVADNKQIRDQWVNGLTYLIRIHNKQKSSLRNSSFKYPYECWIEKQFQIADLDKDGNLSFDEVLDLLNQFNISMNKDDTTTLFNMARTNKLKLKSKAEEYLNFEEFLKFYRMLNSRPELEKIFIKYSVNKVMGPEQLISFLETEQNMISNLAQLKSYNKICESKIKKKGTKHELRLKSEVPGHLTMEDFRDLITIGFYLFNRIVCQDMSQPLSHYFIASSHNSYLMEDQFTGNRSTDSYRNALIKGCRCIELDVWDGADGQPIIKHGYTQTLQIELIDVLKTIDRFAFETSEYPLILSMENHCSLEQQKTMALLLTNILGEYLYQKPISKDERHLPSPESLIRKILIKVNPNSETAQELLDLVIYCVSKKFVYFDNFDNCKFYEVLSIKVNDSVDLAKNKTEDYINYNKNSLSRVYPRGRRVCSTNYNPIPHWSVGAQLVALNYQTRDKAMLFNEALFALNGNCGYVLKPEYLRNESNGKHFVLNANAAQPKRVELTIISGQHIPKANNSSNSDISDPYVVVEVYDQSSAKDFKPFFKYMTKPVTKNGFNPIWNETLEFKVQFPEISFIYFAVKDNNAILGQYMIAFPAISEGYRNVRLVDQNQQALPPPTSIFVRIELTNVTD